jgi:hypothetical protein
MVMIFSELDMCTLYLVFGNVEQIKMYYKALFERCLV